MASCGSSSDMEGNDIEEEECILSCQRLRQ